jgi:hypothetical protein
MSSDYTYPLLEEISNIYASHKEAHSDVYLLACQHILEPQARMFESITNIGIPKGKYTHIR